MSETAHEDERDVCDVIASISDATGIKLWKVAMGQWDPSRLSYEDWALPMKLTGGRVCLKESSRHTKTGHTPRVFYYTVKGDTMRVITNIESQGTITGPDAVIWLKDAMRTPENLEPVLREETPFSNGDEVGTSGGGER